MTEHKSTELKEANPATCTEEGYSGDIYCKDCGTLIEKGHAVEKTTHNFVDGTCTMCGKSDGSINNDNVSATVSTSTDTEGNITYNLDVTSKNDSQEVLADIKAVIENAAHDDAGVKVNFGEVSIYFDSNAVQDINNAASTPLSITKVDGSITTEGDYVTAGFDLENCTIYEFSMEGANFSGGTATVSIPYSADGKNVKVFYVDANGNKTEMQSTYDEAIGMVTFTTSHFSTYVITEITEEAVPTYKYIGWIIAAAVVVAATVIIIIILRKKKEVVN